MRHVSHMRTLDVPKQPRPKTHNSLRSSNGWLTLTLDHQTSVKMSSYVRLATRAKQFYLDENDKLFRRSPDGKLKAVVEKPHRMYILRLLHDHLGHKGFFATKEFVSERFWWPELEHDVHWYVKT